MGMILNRLQSGERWWPAEVTLRGLGLGLLGLCAEVVTWLARVLHHVPPHATRPVELLAAGGAFLACSCGVALLVEGPALFALVDLPVRHWQSTLG